MSGQQDWLFGVIEGFYGKPWSASDRLENADFCAQLGMNSYIYAPKADTYLRKGWNVAWPDCEQERLQQLATGVKSRGLQFGVGFSPYDISGRFCEKTRHQLASRLKEIDHCQPDMLCILFDDMPGDQANLAAEQLRVVEFIKARTGASSVAVCPTYYSYDPVLEKVFGARPANYWSDLGAGLDQEIDVIWTGDKVCSTEYYPQTIESISLELNRKPLIWDNYPVNDSARASRYLHLNPAVRPAELKAYTRGLLVNPMNQCWLSRPAMAGISGRGEGSLEDLLAAIFPGQLADLLARDWSQFQHQGLDHMAPDLKQSLISQYAQVAHPAAAEVCAWLAEQYRFDPDCLTD